MRKLSVTLNSLKAFLSFHSCDILVGKENPAQLFTTTCNFLSLAPKILPVLLTPNCIYKLKIQICLVSHPAKESFPPASRQPATSISESNSNTVFSDMHEVTPGCSLTLCSVGHYFIQFRQ